MMYEPVKNLDAQFISLKILSSVVRKKAKQNVIIL